MSGFYNGIIELIVGWGLGAKPDSVTLKVAAVSDAYGFDAAHTAADVNGKLFESELVYTLDGSTVKVDAALNMTGLTPGLTLQGFVFSFVWEGGTKLICFVNQATDLNLPFTIVANELLVKFADQGVFKV